MRGVLETDKTATYWPPALPAIAVLLSCSAGLLNRGPGGPASAGIWFSLPELEQLISNSDLQLTRTCLLHRVISLFDANLLPVASQFALNSTRRQWRLYLNIFDRMHLLFTQVHFLFWQLGRGQYITQAGTSVCWLSLSVMCRCIAEDGPGDLSPINHSIIWCWTLVQYDQLVITLSS